MTERLAKGGRRIDRSRPLKFRFNGVGHTGFSGDTLASALMANGKRVLGRSFKYHRPRGLVASGAEEPNALLGLGRGASYEPNQRATVTELFAGLEAESQNHWPSLEWDVGAVNGLFARLLPAGFYYKTFIHPRAAWKHVFEPFIRQSAGLGRPPRKPDDDRYEHFYAFVDVLIVGGGIAGLAAAEAAGASGARVLLLEQTAHWGGRTPTDVEGGAAEIERLVGALSAMPNVQMRTRTMGAGVYDHGFVLGYERVADHTPNSGAPRHRLWKIRAKQVVTATGAIERPLSFPGNDIPGVMLAGAVRDYVADFAAIPGRRTVVVTNNDDAYRTALVLKAAGLDVPLVVDARTAGGGALMDEARAAGIEVRTDAAIHAVHGRSGVTAVEVGALSGKGGTNRVACDCVAMSGGWSPVVHLWSHCGGKLLWSETDACFVPDPSLPPTGADGEGFVRCAGAADGALRAGPAAESGAAQGLAAAHGAGFAGDAAPAPAPVLDAPEEAGLLPVWVMPQGAGVEKREKTWLDFQNDVKVSDVELAAQEGFQSVEHAKRYTTLGMATDQGKLSNINGLAILSQALNEEIPRVGTTTFRPPYTPVSLAAVAGEARGKTFQPIRRTPLHAWHEAHGAHWEPVGHWRRPYAYPQGRESLSEAVSREVKNARQALGLLDASTLGKILVKGPDAGRFLDMLYTGRMSTLKPGRCRYGLMCTENGFLSDDGVVARLDEQTFLCHTTTGGADHIHAWMEDWLQCEWWDWQVHTLNVTEAYGQIAVVGPNARTALERLGGMDVSSAALPFMGWAEGEIGGFPARVYRISFSGELSYEIAVPAGRALELWERLLEVGADLGAMPYGTEALHVMRAEKGFIMIGDETDGTVIPQDLGLSWAIAKKKDDYLGKRAQARVGMTDPARWQLVGLETLDGGVLPDGAYAVAPGRNELGQRRMVGRVTSTYYSPTLGRGIAMGLVERGPERLGEVLSFPGTDGATHKARIVAPVFYDPEGEKLDA